MALFQIIQKEFQKLKKNMKKFDVFGVGNALVDCVCLVSDSFLDDNNIDDETRTNK